MKKILLITIPLIIAIAAGAGAWRAWMQMKTLPSNSLKNIRETISAHDEENFYNSVDLDAILQTMSEEIVAAQINSETDSSTYSVQDMNAIYSARQPEFFAAAKAAATEYISKGTITFSPPLNQSQKQLKRFSPASCKIQNISKPVINGGEATAKIEFYNSDLKFSFEIEVTLEKSGKNSWRIIGAKNFADCLPGFNRAMKIKLESLNAPIREKISETFEVKSFDAKVSEGDSYGFSKTLNLILKADVKSEKPLAKIVGQVIIDGKDDKQGITPFEIDMAYKPKGLQSFNVDKVLNPFVREDADVMRHGLKKSSIHIEIVEVVYLDGTILKQFDKLPDD